MPQVPAKTPEELKAHVLELAGDILVAAIEGGSNYWAAYRSVNRTEDLTITDAVIIEWDEDKTEREMTKKKITRESVIKALNLVADGRILPLDHTIISAAHLCRIGVWDGGEMDAYRSDVVLQVALFGEVIYG